MTPARASQPALHSRPSVADSLHLAPPSARRRVCCAPRPVTGARRSLLFWLLMVTLSLVSCTSVRPATKIGLIAPFEGLYRRNGYEALAAMRAAIAETPSGAVGILPLALDDGGDPARGQRAMQKLLASKDVGAIIGPLSPTLPAAIDAATTTAAPPLLPPYAMPGMAGAVTTGDADAWAVGLVQAVAGHVVAQGAQTLVVAGWTPGWPDYPAQTWSALAGLPVRLSDDPATVGRNESVMWLGAPDAGATYLAALRAVQADTPFWLGSAGGDPVFAERAESRKHVYWVVWTDDDYNGWAATHTPSTPSAYLVYRATQEAVRQATGQASATQPSPTWRVQAYAFGVAGETVPFSPAP